MITQAEIKRRLRYEQNAGEFFWVDPTKYHAQLAGARAGTVRGGYAVIKLNGRAYRAHRLAWLYVYGHMPEMIDHINGNRLDNRIANLRPCTMSENAKNHGGRRKKSGTPPGVRKTSSGKYCARIRVDGVAIHIGTFAAPSTAHNAYVREKRRLFGAFDRGNNENN